MEVPGQDEEPQRHTGRSDARSDGIEGRDLRNRVEAQAVDQEESVPLAEAFSLHEIQEDRDAAVEDAERRLHQHARLNELPAQQEVHQEREGRKRESSRTNACAEGRRR
eukprot:scaffold13_cov241-Pinguiococcus_pyrenoidosus.AAC.49